MAFLDRIFPNRDQKAAINSYFRLLNGYTPVFHNFAGSIYESELVRAAIDAKARHISKLKVETRGAAKQNLKTRLDKAPNGWQTWSKFLYQVATILEVKNTVFIVPVLNNTGDTIGIYPVAPHRWELVTVEGDSEPWLRFYFAGEQRAAIELAKVGILTKYQYASEFFGETNEALRDTMDLIKIQRQGIAEGAKNAASYRFMAKVTNFTKPEDLANERKQFDSENLRDGGGLLLFPNTYSDIKQVSNAPYTVDANQLKVISTNVYNYFGVNEKVIQNSANGNDLDAFFNGAIEPFAIQLSQVLTKMLYSEYEQGHGNEVLVTANRLQYMSTSEKINLAKTMGDRGYLMIDEVRDLLNFPPLPNNEGQQVPIRGEYYLLNENEDTAGTTATTESEVTEDNAN